MADAPPFGWRARRRVGLLGGSFNPAHAGHRHVSLHALARLRLDAVWWMVSPQNPLKPRQGMAGLSERLAAARGVARHPRIRVTALEAALGTRYTADTLAALRRRYPRIRFVWLMGADNLVQIPLWARWPAIFRRVPIAVFDRAAYAPPTPGAPDGGSGRVGASLAGRAAQRFQRWRLGSHRAGALARRSAPAWIFLHLRRHPASATAIRAGRLFAPMSTTHMSTTPMSTTPMSTTHMSSARVSADPESGAHES